MLRFIRATNRKNNREFGEECPGYISVDSFSTVVTDKGLLTQRCLIALRGYLYFCEKKICTKMYEKSSIYTRIKEFLYFGYLNHV